MKIGVVLTREEKERIMDPANYEESSCIIINCKGLDCSECPCEKYPTANDMRIAIEEGEIKVKGE